MSKYHIANLPPPISHFVNRRRELREFFQFWRTGKPNILAVTGLGGVGKTALVQHFISRLMAREDSELGGLFAWSFYDNADPNEFLQSLCDYLSNNRGEIKGTLSLSETLNRLASAGRVLIVMDGLEQAQRTTENKYGTLKDSSLESFISALEFGIGSAQCIITTRFPLKLSGNKANLRELSLGELSDAAAIRLIRSVGAQQPLETIAPFLEQYGKHPLSLTLLGSYLAKSADLSIPSTILPGLEDEQSTLGQSVDILLRTVAAGLSTIQTRILEIISTYPEGVNLASLESVVIYLRHKGDFNSPDTIDRPALQKLVHELSDSSLIMISQNNHLSVHPLVKSYFSSFPVEEIGDNRHTMGSTFESSVNSQQLFESIFSVLATGNIGREEVEGLISQLDNDKSKEATALRNLLEVALTKDSIEMPANQIEPELPHVFISYVREDSNKVAKLRSALEANHIEVWQDIDRLIPGVRWKQEIRDAIKNGDFFIACFSENYWSRNKTYMNEELALAIEELRLRPFDRLWFLPVLISPCRVPDRPIGAGETLHDLQHVDLHSSWEKGVELLIRAISNST